MIYQIEHPQTGRKFTVSDQPGPFLVEAPPEYWPLARYWRGDPFTPSPWSAFSVDPIQHDVKLEQFERVQGVFPQRRDWTAAGGAIADFIPGRSRYDQDYDLFLGIIDTPEDLKAGLAGAQPVFDQYGLGAAGCYRFDNQRGTAEQQAERPEIVNLFFENAPLPPPASKRTGRLKWRAEDVTAFNLGQTAVFTSQIVAGYQKALVFGGIYVPKLHPHAQYLQLRNAALAPKK